MNRNAKIMALALVFIMMFSTVAFAAEGDHFFKADGTLAYDSNQVRADVNARNHVRALPGLFQIEVDGELYDLTEANEAFAQDKENWKEILTGEQPVEEPESDYLFEAWHFDNVDSNLTIIVEDVETGDDVEYTVLDQTGNTIIVNLPFINTANGSQDFYSDELAKLDVDGQRMDANDLVEDDMIDLEFVGNNKVKAINVVQVANLDHITVNWEIVGEVATCSAVENVWFTNDTDVAVTVDAFDDDYGTTIVAVGLEGDVATEAAVTDYEIADFEGLFTEDGEYEFNAYATNSASDPVTKATESYMLVVDTTDPELTIDYPTTQTAFEVGVDGNELVAEGTFVEDYLTSVKTKLWINGTAQWQFDDEASEAMIDQENSEWSYALDFSDVNFAGSQEATALLEVKAFDCAGNETYESVEFTIEDTTAPKIEEVVSVSEDTVTVTIDENYKLEDQVAAGAFVVTINNVDFVPSGAFLDTESKEVTLFIDKKIIEEGDDISVSYDVDSAGTSPISDTAGNLAPDEVTAIAVVGEDAMFEDATLMVNSQAKLQDALAVPADVIELYEGTYDGFTVSYPVHIVGIGEVVIEGQVLVEADDVTLENLIIDAVGDPSAVDLSYSNGLTLINNTFKGATRGFRGDWHANPVDITIVDNTFETEYGLAQTEDTNFDDVSGNTFMTTTEAIGVGTGISIDGVDSTDIVNYLENNNTFDVQSGDEVVDYR